MRATAGLDRADLRGGERLVAREELGVLACEDIVGHHAERELVAERTTQLEHQRSLATTDGPSDTDRERALREVALRRRTTLGEVAGMVQVLVRVAVALAGFVAMPVEPVLVWPVLVWPVLVWPVLV